MDLIRLAIPIFGGLLCLFALAQLAFWVAQSWTLNTQNKKQFELARDLLRRQIEDRKQDRIAQSQMVQTKTASSPSIANKPPVAQESPQPLQLSADGNWKGFRDFHVAQIIEETPRCRSVYLRPVDEQPIANFSPGQHLAVKLNIPGQPKPVVRCYSLSNSGGQPFYRISVKAVPAPRDSIGIAPGLASNFVNYQLKTGDTIGVKSPSGHFVLDEKSAEPIVMLAGGIGITPMVSIVEHVLAQKSQRPLILVYGVVNKQDQAFKTWLEAQAAKHSNFMVVNCFSSPDPTDVQGTDYQVPGYVSIELLKQLLPSNQCQFYMCGPPPFMNSLSQGLEEWGVDESRIFSESFGPASRGKKKSSPSTEQAVGTIVFAGSKISKPWDGKHESILELAEDAGVPIDSGCRAGNCGTCAVGLLAGNVRYPDGEAADCEPGQCLTCIAVPDGHVELDA